MRKINIHNKLFFALFAFFAAKDAVNIFSAPQRLCGKPANDLIYFPLI